MLLGNDLAGNLVIPNLTVLESLLNESPTKTLDLTNPHLFPSCAVTRTPKNKNKYSTVAPTTVFPSEGQYDYFKRQLNSCSTTGLFTNQNKTCCHRGLGFK